MLFATLAASSTTRAVAIDVMWRLLVQTWGFCVFSVWIRTFCLRLAYFFFGAFPTSIETQLPLICRHQRGRETDLMTSKLNKLNSDTVAKHPPTSQPVRFDIGRRGQTSGGFRLMWVTRTNRNRLRQIRLFDWRGEKCGIDPKLRLEMACGKIDFLVLHRVLNDDSRKVGTIWYLRTASAAVALQLYHLSFVMSWIIYGASIVPRKSLSQNRFKQP